MGLGQYQSENIEIDGGLHGSKGKEESPKQATEDA